MKLSTLVILSFPFLLGSIVFAQDPPQCGRDAGGALCPNNFCCSHWGFCGNTAIYCEGGCQSQCWNSPPPPPPSPPPPSPPPPSPPPPSPPPPSPPPPSPPPPSPPPPRPSPPPPAGPERPDHRCGPPFGNHPCAPGRCCSNANYCGSSSLHCSPWNCRYQCWSSARLTDLPRALLKPSNNLNAISKLISESLFNEMLKHRKDCPSLGFYTYEAFITAAQSFPHFCAIGDVATRKRELAAFLSQTSQATTGQHFDLVDPHAWGYCHINGTTNGSENEQYCTSSNWPCALGKKYGSRGPAQLTHNYNYGLAGEALRIDLINDPDLVATDPIVSFQTAIWFWMTQHDNNPSLHEIFINANSEASDQVPSYNVISNKININFGHQSGLGTITTSIGYYKRYCDMLQVIYGDNLKNWFDETPFSKFARIKMPLMDV